jgi:hypothetical protein
MTPAPAHVRRNRVVLLALYPVAFAILVYLLYASLFV